MIESAYDPHLSDEWLPKDGKLLKTYQKWLKQYQTRGRSS